MGEKVKDKDADTAHVHDKDELQKGLEDTFPASDPVSVTRPEGEVAETKHEDK